MRQILLVEPGYRNSYPPLGLMKISRYHKMLGDNVVFVKGESPLARSEIWDRIYITTLFTYLWKTTTATIRYYMNNVESPSNLIAGGILASILKDELKKIFPSIRIHSGLLDKPGILDKENDLVIDRLVPDYTILDQIDYKYRVNNAYFAYTTRGCVRRCRFCAVPDLEPKFRHYIPLRDSIELISSEVGPKKDLVLLDNNILASRFFRRIIQEIKNVGFYKDAMLNQSRRTLDFNQGVDLRLLDEKKMALVSETAIKPLRIAFDNISYKKRYIQTVKLAARHGIKHLSNYILYNYNDTPQDLYERLRLSVELNEEYDTNIFSFPMKYIPVNETDRRRFLGKHWTWKMIRGVQCIINATHGVVSPNIIFFKKAFGQSPEEFFRIINMPDRYILFRLEHETNGAAKWNNIYNSLTEEEKAKFLRIIESNRFDNYEPTGIGKVDTLVGHYIEESSV